MPTTLALAPASSPLTNIVVVAARETDLGVRLRPSFRPQRRVLFDRADLLADAAVGASAPRRCSTS